MSCSLPVAARCDGHCEDGVHWPVPWAVLQGAGWSAGLRAGWPSSCHHGGGIGWPGVMGKGQLAALEAKAGKCAASCWAFTILPQILPSQLRCRRRAIQKRAGPQCSRLGWSNVTISRQQPGEFQAYFAFPRYFSQSMLQIIGNLFFYCPFQACKSCLPAPQKQSCAQGNCLASVHAHGAAEAGREFI